MEAAPLKNFATWARTALIREVTARVAAVLAPGSSERVEQAKAVAALERAVAAAGDGDTGRAAVADKVAYTWFNRIVALRFMDANGYTGVGVVSPHAGVEAGQPEILANAKRGVIDTEVASAATRMAVGGLLDGTRASGDPQSEAYALLLADYCRYWNKAMPFMFEREGDYTELLIPANLLADDSVLNRAVKVLTQEACEDVEVIGWLYQFYISERKQEVFDGFGAKGSARILAGPAEIPAATQLFTPHWVVRYLLENSLGRIWLLNRPSSDLANQMDYYIAPVDEVTDFLRVTKPEELKIIDPACGSGHMLTYAFDLLYAIYEEEGYGPAEIPSLILAHNLFGTEIDPRAGALAAFALTMKARAKLRTFFNKHVEPNICVIDPISFSSDELDFLATRGGDPRDEFDFWDQFAEADTRGALIQPDADLTARLARHLETLDHGEDMLWAEAVDKAKRVIVQASYLSQRYHVVVANPPYMGSGNMSGPLSTWIKDNYPAEKQDLYACFVARGEVLASERGAVAMVTGDSWMTAKTFEKYRARLLDVAAIESFVHLRDSAYHADVFGANSAFVLMGRPSREHKCLFVHLEPLSVEQKRQRLRDVVVDRDQPWAYVVPPTDFHAVPGAPISYRLSTAMRQSFVQHDPLSQFAAPKQGIKTGNNDRFLRTWWEVSQQSIGQGVHNRVDALATGCRWFPCQKGGSYRRWFGNDDFVVNWDRDGDEIRNHRDATTGKLLSRPQNLEWLFRGGVTWGTVSSGASSFRICPPGSISESKGAIAYTSSEPITLAALGLLNSSVSSALLEAISPTVDYGEGAIGKLPFNKELMDGELTALVAECVEISRKDWLTAETSAGFRDDSLVAIARESIEPIDRLARAHHARTAESAGSLQDLEQQINRLIAAEYGLTPEVDLEVPPHRVSLLGNASFRYGAGRPPEDYAALANADLIRNLISYAVGCIFGRYSLDSPGLILADQGATLESYLAKVPDPTFLPDTDNVIPIVDGDWFEDDILERFRQFLRAAFGEHHFEENLRFVATALGVKNLRDYFITKSGRSKFYDDHVQRYKKRPIYWMFSSPRGSFNALIYMHRYSLSTVSTVLNEYLREFQAKLKASLEHAERSNSAREADRLRAILLELDAYEHDVLYPLASQNVAIDLDDGVKANYLKLGNALKKLPGLEATE
ncbi:MAG: BREX-1 system adenine-specific DNA-methyltransferase PglX [Actinobacteria bacterium]|nr:BREX-1 system adenine-specific DNA-methyltransferase PglX [Actinomycetota bacterium]